MAAEAMDPAQAFDAKHRLHLKALNAVTKPGTSAVQQFYSGTVAFVTGGTGFLGKQLIEKLLRATNISKILVLMRSKKGKNIRMRLNDMIQEPLYDLLREQHPTFADKIVAVEGDIGELRLGIADEDWKTITEQVNIIFHLAATTRFDEPLCSATIINTRGAREALQLGKACKKLKSFVHVSTAYSNACVSRIDGEVLEEFYPSPVDPEAMIKLAETTDEERLNSITTNFIKNWPNTYTFTKAVAENIVKSMSDELPICVVRPAIVICAEQEPNPGWIDMSAIYGASGIPLGVGIGVIHVMNARDDVCLGLIPVDYVNNTIIAAGWETARRKAIGVSGTKIYTVTTSTRNSKTWGIVGKLLRDGNHDFMSLKIIWYGFLWQASDPVLYKMYFWLVQLIPAYIADGILLLLQKKTRFVKLTTKLSKMLNALSYFTLNNWHLADNNTATLYDNLSTADQEIFNFDVNKLDWPSYMIKWCIGLRKYILKDGLKDSQYAKKKVFVFKILTYIIGSTYFYYLFKQSHVFVNILRRLFFKLFS